MEKIFQPVKVLEIAKQYYFFAFYEFLFKILKRSTSKGVIFKDMDACKSYFQAESLRLQGSEPAAQDLPVVESSNPSIKVNILSQKIFGLMRQKNPNPESARGDDRRKAHNSSLNTPTALRF